MFSEEIAKLRDKLAEKQKTLADVENIQQDPLAKRKVCENHPEHGEYAYHENEMDFCGFKKVFITQCPHCVKAEITQLDVDIQAKFESQIDHLKQKSNIPLRFANCTLDNYNPVNDNARRALAFARRYTEKWQDRFAKGGGLVFCGKPGTGKNHLACAIANKIIEEHQAEVLISTALHIARNVKNAWSKESEVSESDVIKSYTKKDLLIIDEIGVQFGSEAEKIILFEIINTRYEQMKPTILISNLSEQELSTYIGERVLDRMMEGQGAIVAFNWESYRK